MIESRITCPVCGTSIRPELIPTARDASFSCSSCRTQLAVVASDPVPVAVVSVLLSLGLCVMLGLRGLGLVFALIGATAMFYCLGALVRSFVGTGVHLIGV